MIAYLIRRLLQAIPTLIGITVISFAIMQLAPGDPIQLLTFNPDMTEASRTKLRQQLCLDRPMPEQYLIWVLGDFRGECAMRGLIRGDFGTSFYDKRPVLEMIAERIPATLELSAVALAFGLLIGLPLGVSSAIRRGTWFDNASRFSAVVFDAIPSFWFGLILILIFSTRLGWLPVGGRAPLNVADPSLLDRLRHLAMPALVLGVGWLALFSRYMRAETLEVIGQDYVRTARAKGLTEWQVHVWYTARNALVPIATLLGPAIAGLISGAVVIERIFSWPGLGRLTFDAVVQRDYPIVMASVIVGSVLVIAGNLLSDFLYVIIDPRVRLE
ncbi:MAG: ABC transporter permease [Anaerolineae bacterium]|nr:ABC transporter permease [Anaerolineae bacterium]